MYSAATLGRNSKTLTSWVNVGQKIHETLLALLLPNRHSDLHRDPLHGEIVSVGGCAQDVDRKQTGAIFSEFPDHPQTSTTRHPGGFEQAGH